MIRVALIGCGLMGKKRVDNLQGAELVACADIDLARAESLAQGLPAFVSWQEMLRKVDPDIVIVSTIHSELAPVAREVLTLKKHLFIEKPAATSSEELEELSALAAKQRVIAQVGYNHRYHPAFQQAKALIKEGAIGPLMYLRGRYGHGGRIGYDREWRANPTLSGGGELIDQGVHLIDLSRWILESDFSEIEGFSHTYFWDMPVEDNGFLLLKTPSDQVAFLHASCTEWKNLFSFEIYGRSGKLAIEGLGGSYGTEKLTYYQMLPQMGPPETTSWEYPKEDTSWGTEFKQFLESIEIGQPLGPTFDDSRAALTIVEAIYAKSKQMVAR